MENTNNRSALEQAHRNINGKMAFKSIYNSQRATSHFRCSWASNLYKRFSAHKFLSILYCGVHVAEMEGQADQGWCVGIENPNKRENAETEPEVLERFVY